MAITSALSLVNAACALLAVEPLQSLDDEMVGGQSTALLYEACTDFCLGLAPWSFARRTRQLTLVADATSNLGFDFVHQLPAERLGPPERLIADITDPRASIQAYDYDEEGRVHTDYDPLYAMITARVAPGLWSATFKMAVMHALAAQLAEPLTGNSGLSGELHGKAFGTPSEAYRGGLMRVALTADGRLTPARALPAASNPLLEAWGSG